MFYIIKNYSLCFERPVRPTLGKHRTLTATQEVTQVGPCLLTQLHVIPNLQDALDPTPNIQEVL